MPRFMSSKRPINSVKHVIDVVGTTLGGTTSDVPLVLGQRGTDLASPTEVETGSTVSSIFLSLFFLGETGGASGLVDWFIYKNPNGNVSPPELPVPGNSGVSNMRNKIFHEEKGLAATQDGTPMVFKGVIKIPSRFRRIGDNDKFELRILTEIGFNAQFCVKAIYKSYQ